MPMARVNLKTSLLLPQQNQNKRHPTKLHAVHNEEPGRPTRPPTCQPPATPGSQEEGRRPGGGGGAGCGHTQRVYISRVCVCSVHITTTELFAGKKKSACFGLWKRGQYTTTKRASASASLLAARW
jgi:hypothetical protein